jgi:3-methyladenine DNA glycosylase AlkD
MASTKELLKHRRYFRFDPSDQPEDNYFIGVRMGSVFDLAKQFIDMPVENIEGLLESPVHEIRAGALSIMAQSAKKRGCSQGRLKELYELYLKRHDRINNWDLVDLAAHHVVGRHLVDKDRKPLYELALSANMWERRTSIVATAHFIRLGDVGDAYRIAEILIDDPEELVNKATGWMLRFSGDKAPERLATFLEKHAAHMSRVALRNAVEKLDNVKKQRYLRLGRPSS